MNDRKKRELEDGINLITFIIGVILYGMVITISILVFKWIGALCSILVGLYIITPFLYYNIKFWIYGVTVANKSLTKYYYNTNPIRIIELFVDRINK